MRIGLVAAEPSGDVLAAGLMAALKVRRPDISFEGIGGPLMQAQGLQSWHPLEKLSVMGLVEVLAHLPELLSIRRDVKQRWQAAPPDIFIGVDAPDFNLGLEAELRAQGVKCVHYVSPTVWAWRPKRVKKIRRAADLVLCIFPFEPEFLHRHQVPATYIGHPLAAGYELHPDRGAARAQLQLDAEAPVLALLPGSRSSELAMLGAIFLQAAQLCAAELPGLRIVTPLANEKTRALFEQTLAQHGQGLDVRLLMADTSTALAAADVVLVASGTATFEALLSKRPMVVGYRLHPLTYWLVSAFNLVNVDHVAMSNLLSGEALAPELIQDQCTPENLARELLRFFHDPELRERVAEHYLQTHRSLIRDTNGEAAEAVLELLR